MAGKTGVKLFLGDMKTYMGFPRFFIQSDNVEYKVKSFVMYRMNDNYSYTVFTKFAPPRKYSMDQTFLNWTKDKNNSKEIDATEAAFLL